MPIAYIKMPTTEFYFLESSKLIGKKLSIIEDKYKLRIDHIHNPRLSSNTATEPDREKIIQPRLYVKVMGSVDKIKKLLEDSH